MDFNFRLHIKLSQFVNERRHAMKLKQFSQNVSFLVIGNTMRKAAGEVVLLGPMVLLFASSPGYGAEAEWLKAHNVYRCMHDVPPMTWNQTLADLAENTAKQCSCAHCAPVNYWESIYCAIATEEVAVDAWYSEIKNYDYNNPAFGPNTGHFIAVVAKSLTEAGCSSTDGDTVCVYGGNFYDVTPTGLNQNVLRPIRTKEQCNNAEYINEKWVISQGTPNQETASKDIPQGPCGEGTFDYKIGSSVVAGLNNWPGGSRTFGTNDCDVTVSAPTGRISDLSGDS
jgi:uncharacterized protein YkwD